ncbi:hypothetical protein DFA_06328 [Cavenderia fasciculata]|uniref:IPT/TIG domain-containing protein n=1 Tax=Cavenderia fasciculata TaxID=261658 RepID=F4PKQ7_CACFS|nr:uncharacterized protein DFA_06328 [Cavenderia fasciculata]EGG24181.1 hypothetical protein DFA_06328 [Cavenderia fasciculata]|eukprot:XP_004362032.1 hypothetical protein DFA_06328 [Cavenderia fasciculata]
MYKSIQFIFLLATVYLLHLGVDAQSSNYTVASVIQDNNVLVAEGYFGTNQSIVSVTIDQYTPCQLVSFNGTNFICNFGSTPGNTAGNKLVTVTIGNYVLVNDTLYFNKVYSISNVTYNYAPNKIRINGVLNDTGSISETSVYISRDRSEWVLCSVEYVSHSLLDCQLNQRVPAGSYIVYYRNSFATIYSTVNITSHPYTLASLSFNNESNIISARGYFGFESVSVWIDQYTACPLVSSDSSTITCSVANIIPRPVGTKVVTIQVGDIARLNGTLYFGTVNYSISNVSYNSTLNSFRITGNDLSNNHSTDGMRVVLYIPNRWIECFITSAGPSYVTCHLANGQRPTTNTTYQVYLESPYYGLYSTVYIPSATPTFTFSSFLPTFYPLGLEVRGYFGNSSSSVNITMINSGRSVKCGVTYFTSTILLCSLGNNYPVNGGYHNVIGAINNVIYNNTIVYFQPFDNSSSSPSSSSSTSSSDESDVTCTLSRSGKLKVQYPGGTPINCTSQGISECNTPGGFQCLGLLSSSSTRCSAPHEIVCQASSIVCRAGGMSCSIENGQLSIKPDTTVVPGGDNSQSDSDSKTSNSSSISFSLFTILLSLSIIVILI